MRIKVKFTVAFFIVSILAVIFYELFLPGALDNLIFPPKNPSPGIPVTFLPIQSDQTQVFDQPVQSTGCGKSLSLNPGNTAYIQIKSESQNRFFLIYLPQSFDNSVPYPVILAFHGYNETPWNLERYSKFDVVANFGKFIMVYPEGIQAPGGARGWDTGLRPAYKADDALFVSNLLNTLQLNLCINPRQIYASGFSNGGGFVAELACKLSNRLAAFAPVSGSYVQSFSTCKTTRPISIIEFHGNADSIVPYTGIPNLKELSALSWISTWAKRDGCNPDVIQINESKKVTKYTWTGCQSSSAVIHYKIANGKHQWPNTTFVKTDNNRTYNVNGTQTIWDFFSQHPLQ